MVSLTIPFPVSLSVRVGWARLLLLLLPFLSILAISLALRNCGEAQTLKLSYRVTFQIDHAKRKGLDVKGHVYHRYLPHHHEYHIKMSNAIKPIPVDAPQTSSAAPWPLFGLSLSELVIAKSV